MFQKTAGSFLGRPIEPSLGTGQPKTAGGGKATWGLRRINQAALLVIKATLQTRSAALPVSPRLTLSRPRRGPGYSMRDASVYSDHFFMRASLQYIRSAHIKSC